VATDSAVVDSTGIIEMTFTGILDPTETYTLDYFADHNGDGECTSYPDDHVWHQSIGTPTGDTAGTIDHEGSTIDNAGCDSFSDEGGSESVDDDGDGYSEDDGDCDDTNADFNPGASDALLADYDCDGTITEHDVGQADYSFAGEANYDESGFVVTSAGDVDGDGLDDILVGANKNDDGGTDAGKAYIILGASLGATSEIDLADADYSFIGENSGDYAGWVVDNAGDVDGDGLGDILVGAWKYGSDESQVGKTYLIFGASLGGSSEIHLGDADYTFVGEATGDHAGWSVSTAGDVDGDGLDDILIGALQNDNGESDAGTTYLILAASLGSVTDIELADADYSFVGEGADDQSGHSVSTAGDVDGDGLDDILIGAHLNDEVGTDVGKTYIVLAASLGAQSAIRLSDADYSFVGENDEDYAGWSVFHAGDVDGDGLGDVLIGALGNDDAGVEAGKTYLMLGATLPSTTASMSLALADYIFVGEAEGDQNGHSVPTAGDVDGDGLDDILIGANKNDEGGEAAGKCYLILGSSLGSTTEIDLASVEHNFVGENATDWVGRFVSDAGDVNGDGRDDILLGAYGWESGQKAGKTYLILSGL